MNYERMTRLALFVTRDELDKWDKHDINEMVDACGAEATLDFLHAYENRYGTNLRQQIEWVTEVKE